MIKIIKGNVLFSDCTIIAHQTNCFSKMNYGFARNLKHFYEEAYRADLDYETDHEYRLGKCSFALSKDAKRIIFNLYGQYTEDSPTDYEALEKALETMLLVVDRFEAKGFKVKVGLPYFIGCGAENGRGDLSVVHKRIEKLSKKYHRDIYMYL